MNGGAKKKFAVFDIDGTIARTSLLQQMIRVLVGYGRLDIGVAQDIESLLHDSRQRIADDTFGDYMKQAVDMMFSGMPKGMTLQEYDQIINAVVRTSISHTYVYTRQLIQTLKQNNHFLIAISGSELRAVSTYAKALGFDAWIGQVQYLDNGKKLTGEVRALGLSKDKILESLIRKFDLSFEESLAVGDTSSDIPILSMVEQPITFNPNQALFRHAREQGWMIVLERKDMVYGLVKENGKYVLSQTNA